MAENLIDLRRRISSVKNTQKITKAMKTVSASKLRKSVVEINRSKPILSKLTHLLNLLIIKGLKNDNPLVKEISGKKRLIVLFTSDKGLCGAFNTHLIKKTESMFSDAEEKGEDVSLITIGKKGYIYFSKRGYPVLKDFPDLTKNLKYSDTSIISDYLSELYISEQYSRIDFLFTNFENSSKQEIKEEKFLPIKIEPGENDKSPDEYIFEPEPDEIFKTILPKYINLKLFLTILNSEASEHAARMIAMELATQNAIEMIKNLTLTMNKLRQASITKELLEIITATEALSK